MTEAELTILSLIAESPRYGHEVQRLIDERGLREWLTVGFSSVYYILNRLEAQNLLQSELRTTGGRAPARKVYSLTEAGRGVLQTAVSELLRQPRSLGTGFELGLANLFVLKPAQVYRVMTQHRAELRQRLDAIESSWNRHQKQGEQPHIEALFTHSIAVMRSELEWMDGFLRDWQVRYPAVTKDETQPQRPVDAPAEKGEPRSATTLLHRFTTPPDKMIQRLRRPTLKPPTEE